MQKHVLNKSQILFPFKTFDNVYQGMKQILYVTLNSSE